MINSKLENVLKSALWWGMTYGPIIPPNQWYNRRDSIIKQFIEEINTSIIPIDMILHCPNCGMQHIDSPEPSIDHDQCSTLEFEQWDNPPHRSHLCHDCCHIWRPADVFTNGVKSIITKGKADSPTTLKLSYPPECKTDAEKKAFSFGWWKALEQANLIRNK